MSPARSPGPTACRKGRFEYANGGTLFLDEVGDMPLPLQSKLLRVLENQEVFRIGSNEPIKVNVRLLSATNRDLEAAVTAGTFRQDLYYRLKVVTIKLPPLRERREDLPLLCAHFLKELNQRHGKHVTGIAEPLRKIMAAYDWPGNVRELRNADRKHGGPGPRRRSEPRRSAGRRHARRLNLPDSRSSGPSNLVGRPLSEVERYYIEQTLELTGGNREEAARMLGIGERTLYRDMQSWKVQDQIKNAIAAAAGDLEKAAQSLGVTPATLFRKIKKLGLSE